MLHLFALLNRPGAAQSPLRSKLQAVILAQKEGAEVVRADNGEWLLAPKAEAYTAQETQDAQQQVDRLNESLSDNEVEPAQVLSNAPTAAMAWGRSVARTFSYSATLIQNNKGYDGVAIGGETFIGASTKDPEIRLIDHEVLDGCWIPRPKPTPHRRRAMPKIKLTDSTLDYAKPGSPPRFRCATGLLRQWESDEPWPKSSDIQSPSPSHILDSTGFRMRDTPLLAQLRNIQKIE